MIQRQRSLLDKVESLGVCSYQELSEFLNVSTMTVRRDVDELARQNLAVKVLGGVQKATASTYLYESTLFSRLAAHNPEKRAIARRALELIQPGKTIFLDGSTTCLELSKQSDNMVVCIGGQFDPSSLCCVGPTAEDQASKFFVDLAFVSTKGFVPHEGTFESSIATFRIKQIIADQAASLVLLVDHSKFGQRALSKVLDISKINYIVTDSFVESRFVENIESRGCKVLIAGQP